MRTGRFLLTLGLTSAVLATLVPGVFDPAPAARTSAAVVLIELPTPPVATLPTQPAFKAPEPRQSEARRGRVAVPMGCERIVSPLARSTASATIGRCIT